MTGNELRAKIIARGKNLQELGAFRCKGIRCELSCKGDMPHENGGLCDGHWVQIWRSLGHPRAT